MKAIIFDLDGVIVSTHNDGCYFATQLRIYDSNLNDGHAIVCAPGVITSITFSAGHSNATLKIYGSKDGETWFEVKDVTVAKDYADSKDAALNAERGEKCTLLASGFIAGGALMGVVSAAMRFGGINLVNETWLANPWSEVLSLAVYLLLIVYLVKASMKVR